MITEQKKTELVTLLQDRIRANSSTGLATYVDSGIDAVQDLTGKDLIDSDLSGKWLDAVLVASAYREQNRDFSKKELTEAVYYDLKLLLGDSILSKFTEAMNET